MDTDDSQERKGEKQPPEVFYKKAVLSNFAIFTGKHQCRSLFLIKLLKRDSIKETPAKVFACEYCEIFKNTYFEKTLANDCFCRLFLHHYPRDSSLPLPPPNEHLFVV